MNSRPAKKPEDRQTVLIQFRVTPAVAEEINELAAKYGYERNRSTYLIQTARGFLHVDRSKLEEQ